MGRIGAATRANGTHEEASGPNTLSIQSSVAYGHAGNSAAVFPLQRMGFEVWPVNTWLHPFDGSVTRIPGLH